METIVKQTREVGTSAGVLLPRSWLNKKVVVTLEDRSDETIIRDVIDILINEKLLGEVKGIYLIGSYARGDYDFESDVDILIITKKVNKVINYLDYEITLIAESDFLRNLESNLYRLISVNEGRALMNADFMDDCKKVKPKLDLKGIVREIEGVISINEEMIDLSKSSKSNVPDGTGYSIVLRLRETYYVRCLLKNKTPSKKDFMKNVDKNVYNAYLRVKQNKKEINDVGIKNAIKTLNLLKKWLKEIKD